MLLSILRAQAQQSFSQLDSLLKFIEQNSATTKAGIQQNKMAVITEKAAWGNAFSPKIPITASAINNSRLPVNFIPSEVFGGPAGTFKTITLGQQYITTFSISPQIDLINPGLLAKIKSAEINQELVEKNTQLSKLNLYEQTNACYHNILSFQAQLTILKQHKIIADSLLQSVKNKYAEGLVRQQDVNDATINVITTEDKIKKAEISIKQQYLLLSNLSDTETGFVLTEDIWQFKVPALITMANGTIKVAQQELKLQLAQQELRAAYWQNYPTLSLVGNFNYQNNSNNQLFDNANPWIKSYYWGLRLTWDFPTNINKLVTISNNRINSNLIQIDMAHTRIQNTNEQKQMGLDLQNYINQYQNAMSIMQLRADNFTKSKQQFQENILSLDKLILSETDWLNSKLSVVVALANIAYIQHRIDINNSIQ